MGYNWQTNTYTENNPVVPATPAYDALTQQILGQGLMSHWSGEGFGSAEANAADMARILSSIGITDINQFGQFDTTTNQQQEVQTEYTYVSDGGDGMMAVPSGRYYTQDAEGNRTYVDPQYVSQGTRTVEGGEGPVSQSYYTANTPVTQTVYGNKETQQVVPNTYSERQTGNAWGGTFAGSGNTGYRVQFTPDGIPLFYTTGASSNDLANLLGDNKLLNLVANVGAAYFGPLGSAALQLAQGNDLGDAAKAAILTYGAKQIPGLFGDGGAQAALDADIAGGMVPEFGTNAAYDTAMQSAMTPAAAAAIESAYINPVVDSKVDYSLFGDSASAPILPDMGAQGLQVPVNTSVADNVGYSPVDYSLTPSIPFEGLQMPTSPNLDAMGGGQGLTYQTPEGVFSQEGLTPTGTALDLGDPNSFINNPAAIDQAIAESSSPEIPKAVQEALFKQLAGLFAGGLAASAASQPTQTYTPPPAYKPQDTTPTYSPEYFQQMQNYYTGYMPNMPRDVATPLQDWYNTGYTGEDSVTKKLFGV